MSDAEGYAAFYGGQAQPRRYRERATGEEVERVLTDHEEVMAVTNGELEPLDAHRYLVIGDNKVFDLDPGEEFERALTRHQEAFLLSGEFVRRLDSEEEEQEPKAERAPAKKATAKRAPTKQKGQ